ncbi:MAG: glycosyltransferase family 4 protein [Bryobacteraceae bacterium]
MRVAIDASSLLLRSAGIKSYTYHWIDHLRRLADRDEIVLFPFLDRYGRLDHQGSLLTRWQTLPRLASLYAANLPGIPLLDWVSRRVDVFHVSNQVRRPPRRVRLTATIHDLTCWLMPELHTSANVKADRTFAERVLRRAGGLIAVSENTRRDAERILGLDASKIDVIYSGIAQEYFDAVPLAPGKLGISCPYILFVGTVEPRKNLDTLMDAYANLETGLREQYDLLVAGPAGWSSERTLARLRSGTPGIRYLGYVPEEDLPGLTAGATVFAYPSLYEGFGFPLAQAMAAGVASITSNGSCLPEIAAGSALLVDPRSVGEVGAALERVLSAPLLRSELAAKGKARAAACYRWETCAQTSLDFFHRVAGK